MDIWITYCKRVSACGFCKQPIKTGSPMVKGKQWRKKSGAAAIWSYYFRWHPECWLKQGLEKLELHPYVPALTGRKKLQIDEIERVIRLYLLRTRARLISKLKDQSLYGPNGIEPEKIIDKLGALKKAIALVGGIPKSWEKPLPDFQNAQP